MNLGDQLGFGGNPTASQAFTPMNNAFGQAIMKRAQDVENLRAQQRQYWQGALPYAYNEANRDQFNRTSDRALEGYQTQQNAAQQMMNVSIPYLDMLERQYGTGSPQYQAALQDYQSQGQSAQEAQKNYQRTMEDVQGNPQYSAPYFRQYTPPRPMPGPYHPAPAPGSTSRSAIGPIDATTHAPIYGYTGGKMGAYAPGYYNRTDPRLYGQLLMQQILSGFGGR